MKLIIGLGNPGPNYAKTRHNFGFLVLDMLKNELGVSGDWQTNAKFDAEICDAEPAAGEKIILARPQTMMNLSGQAVKAIAGFYQIPARDIWVVHDDFDLPLGVLRLSQDSGSAGHKGVESVCNALGSKAFVRFRLGIRPVGQTFFSTFFKKLVSTNKFVLQKFSKAEQPIVEATAQKTVQAIKTALQAGTDKAKNQFNS